MIAREHLRDIIRPAFLTKENKNYANAPKDVKARLKNMLNEGKFDGLWFESTLNDPDLISNKEFTKCSEKLKKAITEIKERAREYVPELMEALNKKADTLPDVPKLEKVTRPPPKKRRRVIHDLSGDVEVLNMLMEKSAMTFKDFTSLDNTPDLPPPGYQFYFLDVQHPQTGCLFTPELLHRIYDDASNRDGKVFFFILQTDFYI